MLGHELPVAIAVFKRLLVHFIHHVDIELSAEHHVLVHCLGSNKSNIVVSKLKKSVALGSCSLLRACYSKLAYCSELLEETLQLRFVETFGQVSNVDNAFLLVVGDFEFVETTGQLSSSSVGGFFRLSASFLSFLDNFNHFYFIFNN